ncbi:MAG: hypothetical protein QOD81_3020, partial [Solirubrobacteraceae bacterium]|nr:hypothetical protein [Solirubrobacteraceae bacterium]
DREARAVAAELVASTDLRSSSRT